MASTTSGTTSFSLDVDEIIEQALDPLGKEHASGIDMRKARRVLNLVLIELQNKNIPLHKLDFVDQALSISDPDYTLSAGITDILECSIQKSGEDVALPIERRGLREYQDIPMKTMEGRPNLFTTERNSSGVTVIFWPVPESNSFTAKMLVVKRVEDINASYQKVDLPYRYLPLLVKWLSYELAKGKQGIGEEIKARLEKDYKECMPDTFDEDRERTDIIFKPGGVSGR